MRSRNCQSHILVSFAEHINTFEISIELNTVNANIRSHGMILHLEYVKDSSANEAIVQPIDILRSPNHELIDGT